MDAVGNGDRISRTDFYAVSAGNTFPDTDRRFPFCHGKTPFVFSLLYREKKIESVTKSLTDNS